MAVSISTPNELDGRHANGKPTASRRAKDERPASASSLLEYSQNVVGEAPHGLREFQISKCGCDCWYCSDCAERKGYNCRAELIGVLKTFNGLMMLTLTIDPMLFESPEKAYFHVKKKRGISELMRALFKGGYLYSRRYFCVLEFQKDTEQAHFHILIDAARVPKSAIDAAWSKLRPKDAGPKAVDRPAFGMTRFSMSRFENGAVHAARYVTKYLVKRPEHRIPTWVLDLGANRRVPRYTTSRGFWNRPRQYSRRTGRKRSRKGRSYAERITECGTACNIFETKQVVDVATGELTNRLAWIARIFLHESALRQAVGEEEPGRPRLNIRKADLRECVDAVSEMVSESIVLINARTNGGGA